MANPAEEKRLNDNDDESDGGTKYVVQRKRKVEYKQLFFCRACFEALESFENCFFHARNALTSHLIAKSNGCPNWTGTARSKEGITEKDVLIYNLPYTLELEREDASDVFSVYKFPPKNLTSGKFKALNQDIHEEMNELLKKGIYCNEVVIDSDKAAKKPKK